MAVKEHIEFAGDIGNIVKGEDWARVRIDLYNISGSKKSQIETAIHDFVHKAEQILNGTNPTETDSEADTAGAKEIIGLETEAQKRKALIREMAKTLDKLDGLEKIGKQYDEEHFIREVTAAIIGAFTKSGKAPDANGNG